MQVAETHRLLLRRLDPGDAKDFFLLNEDPDVLRYTGDLPFENIKAAEEFLSNYDQYIKYGFGRWAVILKENSTFLGWCGLKYSLEKKEHDLGFRFFKKWWNNGYATESAKASVDLGFNTFRLPCILGRSMKENVASIKVLQNVGMKFWSEQDFGLYPGVIYKIENQ